MAMNDDIRKKILSCPTLPTLPSIAVRVLELAQSAEVDLAELARTITQTARLAGYPGIAFAASSEVLQRDSLDLAMSIVKDMDREVTGFVTDVRLFRLKHASATRLIPLLQSVFAEGAPVPGTEGLATQVSRLRTLKEGEAGKQNQTPKTRAALTIQADDRSNILVVAARSAGVGGLGGAVVTEILVGKVVVVVGRDITLGFVGRFRVAVVGDFGVVETAAVHVVEFRVQLVAETVFAVISRTRREHDGRNVDQKQQLEEN